MDTVETCRHCGAFHTGACPRVKAIEYHRNGLIKRVEYHQATMTDDAWEMWWRNVQERMTPRPPNTTPVGPENT